MGRLDNHYFLSAVLPGAGNIPAAYRPLSSQDAAGQPLRAPSSATRVNLHSQGVDAPFFLGPEE